MEEQKLIAGVIHLKRYGLLVALKEDDHDSTENDMLVPPIPEYCDIARYILYPNPGKHLSNSSHATQR